MTGNNATVTVDGPAAHSLTSNLLANVGMDASDIESTDITVTFNGTDPKTEITLDADGPLAGSLVAQMLSGVDWEANTAVAIDASFTEPEVQTNTDDDSESESSKSAYRPQVTPLVDKVDPSKVQFPADEPARLRENTQVHAVGTLLVRYFGDTGGEWATTEDLTDFADGALETSQVQSALSGLFTRKGLTVRRQVEGASSRKYEHVPTKQLAEEIDRLGGHVPD